MRIVCLLVGVCFLVSFTVAGGDLFFDLEKEVEDIMQQRKAARSNGEKVIPWILAKDFSARWKSKTAALRRAFHEEYQPALEYFISLIHDHVWGEVRDKKRRFKMYKNLNSINTDFFLGFCSFFYAGWDVGPSFDEVLRCIKNKKCWECALATYEEEKFRKPYELFGREEMSFVQKGFKEEERNLHEQTLAKKVAVATNTEQVRMTEN